MSLRATVISGFEIFAIKSPEKDCGAIWLSYSNGGPVASASISAPRAKRDPVLIIRDENFKNFQRLLDTEMHPRTRYLLCIACNRYEVSARFVGRIDYAGKSQLGYGHLNRFKTQLELLSVAEVTAKDLSGNYDPKLYSTQPVRFPTGYIEGKLVSPNGRKYKGVWVIATPAGTDNEFQNGGDSNTDNRGRFKISVAPGRYVVGVNVIRPASEEFPYRKTYAVNANSYSSAQVFSVSNDEHVQADIHLPNPLATRSIPVRVAWPDGRPVADANVWLTERNDPIVVGTAVSHTSASGTFSLMGMVNTDYFIHADIYIKPSYKEFCASDFLLRPDDHPEVVKLVLSFEGAACQK